MMIKSYIPFESKSKGDVMDLQKSYAQFKQLLARKKWELNAADSDFVPIHSSELNKISGWGKLSKILRENDCIEVQVSTIRQNVEIPLGWEGIKRGFGHNPYRYKLIAELDVLKNQVAELERKVQG